MKLECAHSFLVQPAKGQDPQPTVAGTSVPNASRLLNLLVTIFERAPAECDIQVTFVPDEDGSQNNVCKSELERYARTPNVSNGRSIAERLQRITTHRSGLGLFFLMKGSSDSGQHMLVLSRFPADEGVVATEKAQGLDVEYLERVFMKTARAYKSAMYTTESLKAGFQTGSAVDKQLSGRRDLSNYWIFDFLHSTLRTNSAFGSKRIAVALKEAVKHAEDPDLKNELISVARLLRSRDGEYVSASGLIADLGVSAEASARIRDGFPRDELIDDTFRFSISEFEKHVQYKAIELSTGAIMMAETSRFDEAFRVEYSESGDSARFVAEGQVIDQQFRNRR